MTAKEYLKQALTIDQSIKTLELERNALLDSITSINSQFSLEAAVMSGGENKREKQLADYVDRAGTKAQALQGEKEALLVAKVEIAEMIDKMPRGNRRNLLRWRYVALASWGQIRDGLMGTSIPERRMFRIHSEAIKLFEWTNKEFFGKM